MRLWVISDLHYELQEPIALPRPDADVCVLAGDIARPLWESVVWAANNIMPRMPVVLVPGNHEFYRFSVAGALKAGTFVAGQRKVHLLNDSSVVLGGVRFVGGTLWTDYALYAAESPGRQRDMDIMNAMRIANGLLTDHAVVRRDDVSGKLWQPDDALAAHRVTVAYLDRVLAQTFDGPTVVVTHHAPHPKSVAQRYVGHRLTPAFASDLTWLIERHQPDLWVHGHVHNSADYHVGRTRVVCNPRGYGAENPDFDPSLMVKVS